MNDMSEETVTFTTPLALDEIAQELRSKVPGMAWRRHEFEFSPIFYDYVTGKTADGIEVEITEHAPYKGAPYEAAIEFPENLSPEARARFLAQFVSEILPKIEARRSGS
jgi:hypothetical protein